MGLCCLWPLQLEPVGHRRPHIPRSLHDVSDVIVTVGVAFPSDDSSEIPFQSFKKVCHHMRSDLKLIFRQM